MKFMVAHKLRAAGLFGVVACSSTAKGPAATGALPIGSHTVDSAGASSGTVAAVPAVTCERAMQNLHKLWVTASLQTSSQVQAIYANAGTKLTPALLALCQSDVWSPAGRTCIAQAASLAAIDVCTRDFSASQQTHLVATTVEIINTVDVTLAPAAMLGRP